MRAKANFLGLKTALVADAPRAACLFIDLSACWDFLELCLLSAA